MKALQGFATLLCAQATGEVFAQLLKSSWGWTIPGPVLGMLLLCLALLIPWVQRWLAEPIGQAAHVLLTHLSLLFVPVGVGVVVHLGLLSAYGLKLFLVLVLSTWLGLAVTALVLRSRWPTDEGNGSAPLNLRGQPWKSL